MNRLFLIITFLLSVATAVVGQSILDIVAPSQKPTITRQTDSVPADDAVYAPGSVKKYGWHYPSKIIDKKNIRNYFSVLKFSKKDKAGHYTRVELIDGFGNPNPGALTLSIQGVSGIDSITIADENINTIMSRASIMEFISDADGKDLLKERISDSDGNLLFTTSIVHPEPNIIKTTVFDRFGSPIKCGKDSADNSVYPIEQIVFDKWGYDSVTCFFDREGNPLLNTDLAVIAITANDSLGNVIRRQSADLDGNLIIDIAENCGYSYEYDSNGNVIKATNRDNNWQPIPVKQGDKIGTTYLNYEYDNFGRQTRLYFTDTDGNPDTTALGTHEISFSYGPELSTYTIKGLNLEGKPSPIYTDGRSWTSEYYKYENGKQTEYHILDINGKPYSDMDYYSSRFNTYDTNGNLIDEEGFIAENNVEQLYYKNHIAPDSIYTQWYSGDYRIRLLDKKGRIVSDINYSHTGELDSDLDIPKIIAQYIDKKKHCRIIEKYFNCNNQLNHIEVTDIDSIAHTKDFYILNIDSVLYESYRWVYDSSFNELLAQYNINGDGKLLKCASSNSYYYGKASVRSTPHGEIAAIFSNDFNGNPDFRQGNLDDYCHIIQFRDKDNAVRFDIDNSIINYLETTEKDRPQALAIEIINSIAYSADIKDNDIILQYGDYILDWDIRGINDAYGYWALKSVLNADSEKELIVYRPESTTEKSSIHRIQLPKGTPSELGFKAHVLNQTYPQIERINAAVATYNISNSFDTITSPEFFHYPLGNSPLAFLVPPKNLSQNLNNFIDLIGDPALLTYVNHPAFLGFDCLSFHSLYNLVRVSNYNQKQSERYGDDYVEPDYLANPTYFVTTGNGVLKSFQKQADSEFWYCYFSPSSADSLRLLSLPVLKQNPEPYISKLELNADMPKEQLDSLYWETYDAYMADLDELAAYRMKEFIRLNYTPAFEILAICYGYGLGVPLDYDIAEEYAKIAYETEDTPFGFRPLTRHYIEIGEFERAKPYLELMANSTYPALKKEALKTLSDEYFSRNDSITAFNYLNDYVTFLNFNDPDDEEEITRVTTLYEEFKHPIAAKGLLNLGSMYLFNDLNSETGCSFISRCYDINPLCETDELSISNIIYILQYNGDNFDNYPNFKKFKDKYAVTVLVAEDENSQAASIGWSGEYYLLKFGDWNIYSHSSIFTDKEKYIDGNSPAIPFEVVLMDKKGKIVSHTFTGALGVMLKINHASPKEVRKVRKAYDKWLKKAHNIN